jgi:putative alpha-1,2-mannosidase
MKFLARRCPCGAHVSGWAGGKVFTIIAKHNPGKNYCIQSASLNGQPLIQPWFTHADIANGGFFPGLKPRPRFP